jgi:hypothetical protein
MAFPFSPMEIAKKILSTGWNREQGKIIEPISVYGPSPVNQDCHSHSWGSQFPESTQLPMVQGVFEFAPRIGIEKIRISYSPKFRDEAPRVTANRSTLALLDNAEFWPTKNSVATIGGGKTSRRLRNRSPAVASISRSQDRRLTQDA